MTDQTRLLERVQIPVYTDRWMMGDRYGVVVRVVKSRKKGTRGDDIAYVQLDKSGKTLRFIYSDCTPV